MNPERISTGCVYAPVPTGYTGIVVMRWWPRGIARGGLVYLPQLAPSRDLLAAYRHAGLTWAGFAARYLAEMDGRKTTLPLLGALHTLAVLLRDHPIILLCCEPTDVHCHRRLLHTWLRAETDLFTNQLSETHHHDLRRE